MLPDVQGAARLGVTSLVTPLAQPTHDPSPICSVESTVVIRWVEVWCPTSLTNHGPVCLCLPLLDCRMSSDGSYTPLDDDGEPGEVTVSV
jgi:hypothetical protein